MNSLYRKTHEDLDTFVVLGDKTLRTASSKTYICEGRSKAEREKETSSSGNESRTNLFETFLCQCRTFDVFKRTNLLAQPLSLFTFDGLQILPLQLIGKVSIFTQIDLGSCRRNAWWSRSTIELLRLTAQDDWCIWTVMSNFWHPFIRYISVRCRTYNAETEHEDVCLRVR